MNKKNNFDNKIALISGSGTGKELVELFDYAVKFISKIYGKKVITEYCNHTFSTYYNSKKYKSNEITKLVETDLLKLQDFYRDFYRNGGKAVFRTAINAETLYRFRSIEKSVKSTIFPVGKNTLLLVRDQMQGFYCNENYITTDNEINFEGKITKENLKDIIDYSIREAQKELGKSFDIWIVYKHHLFGNTLEKWCNEYLNNVYMYQPNHATDELYKLTSNSNKKERAILLIAGNEFGDIIHEILLFSFCKSNRFISHSKNVYLNTEIYGLIEYQTVHGSADDLEGKNLVNPIATLKAVSHYLEEFLKINNFQDIMTKTINKAIDNNFVTPDMNGNKKSKEVVNYILNNIKKNKE